MIQRVNSHILEKFQASEVSKEYLNNVIESMADSLFVVGPDLKIKTVNRAALVLLGYTEDELVGQPIKVIFAQSTVRGTSLDTLLDRGLLRRSDKVFQTKDARTIPVSFSGAVMRDQEKKLLGIVCVAQDISVRKQMETALKESEERYRSVFENATDTIFTLDLNGVIVSLNPAFQKMTGWPRIEWIGKRFVDILSADSQQTAQKMLELARWGELPPKFELNLLSRAGQTIVGEFTVAPLKQDQAVIGILGIGRDITERKRAEAELQRLYAELAALERFKTEMIRMAAHDLSSPISSISLSTQFLRRKIGDQLSERALDQLTHIERATTQMAAITANFLSLERIEKYAQNGFAQPVDLSEIVTQAYKDFGELAKRKRQKYVLDLPPGSIMVAGDPTQLRQAVAHLIGNAAKYTQEEGEITVNLRLAGGMATFEVQDTGCGVPQDQQAHLFQPFFHVNHDLVNHTGGSGLGLHLVKNIIERHRGNVHFKSVEGRGSTFGFQVPLSPTTSLPDLHTPSETLKPSIMLVQ